jgi:hypothetical protein
MPHDTTTVRVSRRAHQILSELAAQRGASVADLLDELAEQERRRRILEQSSARMAELMSDPEERRSYFADLASGEAVAADALRAEPPYADERARA